jgi:HD-like signal output (HDOD) protein
VRRILFVDDEPNVLEGLQRMLRPMRHEWETAFAEGGPAALELLETRPFDVIVSDMRMPGMDGSTLLAEVRRRHPQTIRIVLSGQSEQEVNMKSVGLAHQYLSKPCDAESLKETIGRACALRDLMISEPLQLLISQMESLPSIPALYAQLIQELESRDSSMNRIGEIVAQDVGMTAKLLQMVNSAFFGLQRHISNPADAASFLGIDTIRALVLSIQVFSQFDESQVPDFSLDELWSHSMAVAKLAKQIARAENQNQQVCDEAFAAGMLHEAGQLVLASSHPRKFTGMLALARVGQIPRIEAERIVFGAGHPEIGAYLLGLWGLPHSIVEAVAFHLQPDRCPGLLFSPLTALHISECLVTHAGSADMGQHEFTDLDLDYLGRLDLTDRVAAWREIQA